MRFVTSKHLLLFAGLENAMAYQASAPAAASLIEQGDVNDPENSASDDSAASARGGFLAHRTTTGKALCVGALCAGGTYLAGYLTGSNQQQGAPTPSSKDNTCNEDALLLPNGSHKHRHFVTQPSLKDLCECSTTFSCPNFATKGKPCYQVCCIESVPQIPPTVPPYTLNNVPGAMAPGAAAGADPWSFTGTVEGQPTTLYVVGNQDAQHTYVQMLPNGFRINGMSRDGGMESRFYVVRKPPTWQDTNIAKDVLEPWKLGQGSVLKTKVKRGNPDNNNCNVAFYLVGMPADNPGVNRDWYCDANSVGGNTCWEQDIIESTDATVCTSHTWGDGGGQGYANGDTFQETTITYRDGKTIDGDVAYGTGQDVAQGTDFNSAIVTSIWYCDGWPGMPASSGDRCNEGSSVEWTDWEITESG